MADLLPIPDPTEITRIVRAAKEPNDEVNQAITLGYHQLSEAIRQELGAEDSLGRCGEATGYDDVPVAFSLQCQLAHRLPFRCLRCIPASTPSSRS